MRKSATKHSLKTLRADINPAGSKLIRRFCRVGTKHKYPLAMAIKWCRAHARKFGL